VRGIDAEGRSAGDKVADAAAETGAEFGVDEFVGELPGKGTGLFARGDGIAMFLAGAKCPGEEAALDG